jgi:sterol 3beta-glucosyltransferase
MITILSAGTRGDTQPYIALALELKKIGYDIRIAAGKSFAAFIKGYGVEVMPIYSDISSIDVDSKVIRKAMKADNPLKLLLSFNKMKKYAVLMQEDFYDACDNSELIIYHPGASIGYFAARKLGIPSVMATPFPLNKTREYPSVILYGKIKPGKTINLLSYSILQAALWLASKSAIKAFWKQKFKELPRSLHCPFELQTTKSLPTICNCSNFVFPRPTDWDENIHQEGYWFLEEGIPYTPSKDLADFLSSGDAPVYVGFGSAFVSEQSVEITHKVIEALRKSGKRGVLATGMNGMHKMETLPDTIYMLDNIPHSWLFKHVCMVVHHGGAGTTAAGLKAGVPTIVIPFGNDQLAWGQRVYDLGVGSRPIPIGRLTADKLADAITFALREDITLNAQRLGKRIATENGAMKAATVIKNCIEEWSRQMPSAL